MREMEQERMDHYRERLLEIEAEICQALSSVEESTGPVAPDPAIGRLTRMDAMQAQQMAMDLKRRHEARLHQVRLALERIAGGDYGVCSRCEEEIGAARLEVRPETRLCIQCADRASR